MSPVGGAMSLLLFAQWVTVMSQNMTPSALPEHNLGFPQLPEDFKEMAKQLMLKCSKKGYPPPMLMSFSFNSSSTTPLNRMGVNPISLFPALLSSLPHLFVSAPHSALKANETAEQELALNLTEKMWNCTSLPQIIKLMSNTTEKCHCFMRAFVAPLSWAAVLQNATQLDMEQLRTLLWAAKPLLETMPPSPLVLPATVQSSHLAEMMKFLCEVFSSLSEGQREQIRQWMKHRVLENDPSCQQNVTLSATPVNSSSPGCAARKPWLKAEVLRMMGRFVSRLTEEDVNSIPANELCKFFQSPEFLPSFTNVGEMQPVNGQNFYQRLKRECSNGSQTFLNHLDRLGSLACFYDDAQSLNATLSKKLLYQLGNCENSGTDKMKKELVRKMMSDSEAPPTLELLRSLGASASILPAAKLASVSSEVLRDTLSSLSQAQWMPAQAMVLARKLLDKDKDINGETLLAMGSMVRGVESELLKRINSQGLLRNQGLKNISEKMSSLQKKALLVGMQINVSMPDLVKQLPDPLLPSLSLSTLDKANINSVDQVDGRSWSRAQSVYLLKKIFGKTIKPQQIRSLGQAVQGVTCDMVGNVNQSDALEMAQALANFSDWLSRSQVHCIAHSLFLSLEKQRPAYFTNISDAELLAIPALLLVHLPAKMIQGLPDAVCPHFLEKMSQANFSSLANNVSLRGELRNRALRCLGKNASELSPAEVLSLGPVICELDPTWISSLKPSAMNSTLQALATCGYIPYSYRGPLFKLLISTYGDPSGWSEDVMKSLGPLLLWNDTALEMLPSKAWLKSYLSDLLDRMLAQAAAPTPEKFRFKPDLLALRHKLFWLKTGLNQQRRRREVSSGVQPSLSEPTLSVIEDLGQGNVYWSPTQLFNMTAQTFKDAVSVLGEIRNYTAEQLSVLKKKAVEVWGDVTMLNETQIVELGCVSQGFNEKQLQNLNITSLDTLELLSVCNWNQTQMAAIWQGFTDKTGLKILKLGALEMVGLGSFICGLQPNQTDQLNTGEFKEAVGEIGRVLCPLSALECLKRKAVAAFGDPKGWGEAEVSTMGNTIAGLTATELASLKSSVLPFIQQSAISLIPPERLVALSVSQLRALGPDNAAMITDTQRQRLAMDQRAAVDEAVGLAIRSDSISSTTSPNAMPQKGGAPEQTMFGIVTLLQPLALLLLRYIH
ncbi:otoancorin [Electrophorus electricus]|uniref:otoancorin n=1 Tax=Electrophorus electricus TaxID=8005 RepID=UPI0015D04C0F|nr:otoancorin [Electrophorus electricus]